MRYRWAILVFVLLVLAGATLIGQQNSNPGPPSSTPGVGPLETPDKDLRVVNAVSRLDHGDYVVVRRAIVKFL